MRGLRPRGGVVVLGLLAFLFAVGALRTDRTGDPDWPHPEPLSQSAPSRLVISKLDLSVPVGQVGVQRSGRMAVPRMSKANEPAWFRHGPVPGEPGTAVIVGHLDSETGPAVFHRLRELARGDVITVTRRDGQVVTFTVTDVGTVSKTKFPTEKVYGLTDAAELRLITCGGHFDRERETYADNVIVYARLGASK